MSNSWSLPSEQPDAPTWWSSDEWSTPPEIVAELEAEFGPFDLDPCCRIETAKAPKFYTKSDNGLVRPWTGHVFVNPPYSQPTLWVRKAKQEYEDNGAFIVMLLPAATDTEWFHKYVWKTAELRFIRRRVRFYGWQGTPIPAPRNPSLFAIYGTPERTYAHENRSSDD